MTRLTLILAAAVALLAVATPVMACEKHIKPKEDEVCHRMLKKGDKSEALPDCCKKEKEAEAHSGHGHGAEHGDASPSTRALQAANAEMHKEMNITYSGDADIDFLRGMIAHHAGAVKMAEVQLEYGKDPQVKRLAREIIRAQNLEIKWMQKWLAQLDKSGTPAPALPTHGKYHDETWTGGQWMGER